MDQVLSHTVYVDRARGYAFFASSDLVKRLKRNLGGQASSQKAWGYLKKTRSFEVESVTEKVGDTFMLLWRVSIRQIYIPESALKTPDSVKRETPEIPF